MDPEPARKPHLVIEPGSDWRLLDWREIWQYRDLLLTLAARDVKLRYRQTVLGPIWILLGPLLTAGVFSFIFGSVAKLNSEGVPYFLFVFAGQLGWNLFNNTVAKTQVSLINNQQLVSKIYFPRLILPLSSVFSALIDFGVALGVMVVLMIICEYAPPASILMFPVFLLLLLLMALGVGLISAALLVSYRDVSGFVGVLLSLLMYASPVVYAVSEVPAKLLPFYYWNPMVSLIQGFRWTLLGTSKPPWGYVTYAAIVVCALFVAGTLVFNRMERKFADVI